MSDRTSDFGSRRGSVSLKELSEFSVYAEDGEDEDASSLRGVSSARSSRSHETRTTGGRKLGSRHEHRRRSISNPLNAIPKGYRIKATKSFTETIRRASLELDSPKTNAANSRRSKPADNIKSMDSVYSEFAPQDGRKRLSNHDGTLVEHDRKSKLKVKVGSVADDGSNIPSPSSPPQSPLPPSPSPASPVITVTRSSDDCAALSTMELNGGGAGRRSSF